MFSRKPKEVKNRPNKAFVIMWMVLVKSTPEYGISDVYLEKLSRFLPFENFENYDIMDELVEKKLVSELKKDQHSYYSLTKKGLELFNSVDIIQETSCLINERSEVTMLYLKKLLEIKRNEEG